jgi:hypothetical protein
MKRTNPLRVEVLEDRCVPAADLTDATVALAPAPTESYVIDPPLIDPSVPSTPSAPPANSTSPQYTPLPTDLILPIAMPFWF